MQDERQVSRLGRERIHWEVGIAGDIHRKNMHRWVRIVVFCCPVVNVFLLNIRDGSLSLSLFLSPSLSLRACLCVCLCARVWALSFNARVVVFSIRVTAPSFCVVQARPDASWFGTNLIEGAM